MNYRHFFAIATALAATSVIAQTGRHREYTPSPVAGPAWNAPGNMNPFIPGYFADPTIRRFGDIYYLYATTDGTGNGYGPAQVWASRDFVNWQNMVMNWPTTEVVWAPDVVEQGDGRFRYYYCEPCNILAGESTSPTGPWKNMLGKDDAVLVPDHYVHNVITLDPQLFRDDDGQEYLYFTTWGIYDGFGCGVARLNSQFTIDNSQLTIHNSQSVIHNSPFNDARHWREDAPYPIAADEFFTEKRLIPNTELKDIFEAPFVFKRNGVYYFTYSSGSCHTDTYRVQYATSTVGPMGPFEYKGEVLTTNEDQTVHGPGHHSILEKDGRYYIVYHRHNMARSVHGFNRQVCIDELRFDADGNILPVVPTHNAEGVGLFNATKHKNLAFGATVTASSHYDEHFRPECAVDDNNATLWKARHTNWGDATHRDEWIQLDMGKAVKFTEVWTQFEYATFFYQYKIETSLDGETWTLFADRTQNTTPGSPMIDRAQGAKGKGLTKARYLRLTITDTQKNGHMPAVWNIKVWRQAPRLPFATTPMPTTPQQKDVPDSLRREYHSIGLDAQMLAPEATEAFDITDIEDFEANKPIRLRVKDGRRALFFNGTQHLTSLLPLPEVFRYNSPYTITAMVMSTKTGPVSTVVSLGSSRADLANTELRLGTDPQAGLVNHNGSFESYGAPKEIKEGEGRWQLWIVTYDGWKERVYVDGRLVHEQNNFLMIRPEGHITIGADAAGTNNFTGYIRMLSIRPESVDEDEVAATTHLLHSLPPEPPMDNEPFDETDPDSRFTLPPAMKPLLQKADPFTLTSDCADFNTDPLHCGGHIYKDVEGDFVAMVRLDDMEGLDSHSVPGYCEGGLLISDGQKIFYQLGAFPLYNCGNMFTILSPQGRPQFPNYKGYDLDRYMQFERRGSQLFARTSPDGLTWQNMPGSPVDVGTGPLGVGTYQTTYTDRRSWVRLADFTLYGNP